MSRRSNFSQVPQPTAPSTICQNCKTLSHRLRLMKPRKGCRRANRNSDIAQTFDNFSISLYSFFSRSHSTPNAARRHRQFWMTDRSNLHRMDRQLTPLIWDTGDGTINLPACLVSTRINLRCRNSHPSVGVIDVSSAGALGRLNAVAAWRGISSTISVKVNYANQTCMVYQVSHHNLALRLSPERHKLAWLPFFQGGLSRGDRTDMARYTNWYLTSHAFQNTNSAWGKVTSNAAIHQPPHDC
ncbi:uncharacterized protein BCR38DRAFT_433096 [Pseudomassariella vexata]|uniref:Uncharacterized protein n=1 Tax=Pseudomassariella vexata TaxID=1141098 RepID=A0A1Y2E1Z1_9PEZI|nr:uncharacterized protein BCR38DRAFT_433096 [Pseudomassariella vexata]ORY65542.1 hypothetical protein BCR38DRAFT_433096 [Pseudomassariella vexata]